MPKYRAQELLKLIYFAFHRDNVADPWNAVKSLVDELNNNRAQNVAVSHYKLLHNMNFGPGNRPYWAMKESQAPFRYPDLIKALKRESDPSQRRQILARHKTRIFGSRGGTVQTKVVSLLKAQR